MRLSIIFLFIATTAFAQVDKTKFQDLEYRLVGPFRASRTVGAVGIPSQPSVFYVGVNNGGVWKTTDYGRTWKPIFDDSPTGSVGDIAISLSNPDILYVGSGEGLHRPDLGVGDGMFKSIDGGESWQHIGLADIQQVGRVIVHPENPEIVFVAGLGHPYGANEERGVFRTINGGATWEKVLYINHNTGAIQVEFDPTNPEILFADMWEHQEGPWENARFSGKNSGLYKSIDGGDNWKKLTNGLPTDVGRIGVGIAPGNSNKMYATVDAGNLGGIYMSNDAGESWQRVNDDYRLWGRGGDFGEIKVHPEDENKLYVGNISAYQSNDGGKSWMAIKGAPGGDDYHRIWINPANPDIMIFAADQGATITVNGGVTWSSWYNQPTSQIYHVATDNQFPYWVYGGQQESGAIGTSSRGNGGQISVRDWMGVGADEYAYIAPDPKNHNIIYGGRVIKFNKLTGQSQNIAPEAVRSGKYRFVRTMPLMFHPKDPDMLLFATNVLWKTTSGGQSWEIISPDLSNPQPKLRESIGDFRTPAMETMARRGVIYALGPSHVDVNTIWAGTDDGWVHLTTDGGNSWKNVTPDELDAWDKISQIDASHFNKESAYIAINGIRNDDLRPHIYRTHDSGETWEKIVEGLPAKGPVNVVREDPKQPGLLYAGTEREIYFSTDDGDHWQSLRLNMPPTSIRDLVIHDNDLVVGTHGRSIFILDNISILREMNQVSKTYLFQPPIATRVRNNMFLDTPFPPEEPTGQNPPDGAIIDYYLGSDADRVSIDIFDNDGKLVRSFSNYYEAEFIDSTKLPHPTYWIKPAKSVGSSKGHHRLVWDLRYTQLKGTKRQFSISAVYNSTPSGPNGPYIAPGSVSVKLSVDGIEVERSLTIRMDPRVESSIDDIREQTNYSMRCYDTYHKLQVIREEIDREIEEKSKQESEVLQLRGQGQPGNADMLYGSIYSKPAKEETVVALQQKFIYLLEILQSADVRPTDALKIGLKELEDSFEIIQNRWAKLKN